MPHKAPSLFDHLTAQAKSYLPAAAAALNNPDVVDAFEKGFTLALYPFVTGRLVRKIIPIVGKIRNGEEITAREGRQLVVLVSRLAYLGAASAASGRQVAESMSAYSVRFKAWQRQRKAKPSADGVGIDDILKGKGFDPSKMDDATFSRIFGDVFGGHPGREQS